MLNILMAESSAIMKYRFQQTRLNPLCHLRITSHLKPNYMFGPFELSPTKDTYKSHWKYFKSWHINFGREMVFAISSFATLKYIPDGNRSTLGINLRKVISSPAKTCSSVLELFSIF